MFKVEPDRLIKEELEYEITLRGVTPQGNVKELISTLRELINLESEGHSFKSEYNFKSGDELLICQDKIKEIEKLLTTELTPSTTRKIKTKLAHLLGRIERITPLHETEIQTKKEILTLALKIVTDFKVKQESVQVKSDDPSIPLDIIFQQNLLDKSQSTSTPKKSLTNNDSDEEIPTKEMLTLTVDKKFDISSWGVTFTGKSDSISLNAFLERVDELCKSKGVSEQQLFKRSAELFEGEAKVYYRAVKDKAHDWNSLCNLFREEFFRGGNEKIWEQIKARTQGSSETVAIYVAYMLNLFGRLSIVVDEGMKLQIIKERIRPEYQNKLDLIEISSLDHLIQLGRRIEDTHRNISNFVPPSYNKNFLEVDLQYKDASSSHKKRLDNIQSDKFVTFKDNKLKDNGSRDNSKTRRHSGDNSLNKRDSSRDNSLNRQFNIDSKSNNGIVYNRDNSLNRRDSSRDNSFNKTFNSGNSSNRRDYSRDNSFNRKFHRDNSANRNFSRDNSLSRNFNRDRRDYNRDRSFNGNLVNRQGFSGNREETQFEGRGNSRFNAHYSNLNNNHNSSIICFKCKGQNHLAKHCTVKVLKCYTCGLVGYTRNTCIRCNPQGNYHRD